MIAFLLSPIGRLVMAGIAGAAIGFSGAWTVQGWRLDSAKAEHNVFVAKSEALGDQAKAEKLKKEQEHEKVLADVSKSWQGSLNSAVNGAVANYRMRHPNASCCSLSGTPEYPKAPNRTGQESVVTSPGDGFIQDCAADAAKIESFQTWVRGIGFPVK